MAKPYQEGKTWSIRLRIQRQDIYLSGFASAAAALKAATKQRQTLENLGKPIMGLGHLGQGFLWNLSMLPAHGEMLVLRSNCFPSRYSNKHVSTLPPP